MVGGLLYTLRLGPLQAASYRRVSHTEVPLPHFLRYTTLSTAGTRRKAGPKMLRFETLGLIYGRVVALSSWDVRSPVWVSGAYGPNEKTS